MSNDAIKRGDEDSRPLAPATGGIAGATSEIVQLADYLGSLFLFAPLQWEEVDSEKYGKQDVLVVHAIRYSYKMGQNNSISVEWSDFADQYIFWEYVQRQISEQSSEATPWVVGKLARGRAYRINPPIAEDIRAAALVLEQFNAKNQQVMGLTEGGGASTYDPNAEPI